jgi:hypothetical protein
MDYSQLIRNWHAKASEENYFSKFVFEYLAFIAFLRKKRFIDCEKDRCALHKLKSDSVKDLLLQKIKTDKSLKRAWEKTIEELRRARLNNISGGGDNVEEVKWWNCSMPIFKINRFKIENFQKVLFTRLKIGKI